MAQRPLRKHTCECCKRNFFSRSGLSRFCGSTCQVRSWRANNKQTHEQLEQQFVNQELEKASQLEKETA